MPDNHLQMRSAIRELIGKKDRGLVHGVLVERVDQRCRSHFWSAWVAGPWPGGSHDRPRRGIYQRFHGL